MSTDRDQQQAIEIARAYFGSTWGPEVMAENKILTKQLAAALTTARADGERLRETIEALIAGYDSGDLWSSQVVDALRNVLEESA